MKTTCSTAIGLRSWLPNLFAGFIPRNIHADHQLSQKSMTDVKPTFLLDMMKVPLEWEYPEFALRQGVVDAITIRSISLPTTVMLLNMAALNRAWALSCCP